MRRLSATLGLLLMLSSCATSRPAPAKQAGIIVDTDVGSDDLLALAFLLSRPDVRIEAITVANGLAHVDQGARMVLRLLELAHRNEIPVYVGRATPLQGNAAFPAEWRKQMEELAGVE